MVSDLRHGKIAFYQEHFGSIHLALIKITDRGYASIFFKESVELWFGISGNRVNGFKIEIVDIVVIIFEIADYIFKPFW